MRMFVAVVPPADALADLERFLEPRVEAAGEWRWSPPENWHITLAFLGDVADPDRLSEPLTAAATRTPPLQLALRGAGAFPNLARAKHLYQAVAGDIDLLAGLAGHVRSAAQSAGASPDGKAFRPHLSIARGGDGSDVTHLWRALDSYEGPAFDVTTMHLFRSELGQGRNHAPRYDVWESFDLG